MFAALATYAGATAGALAAVGPAALLYKARRDLISAVPFVIGDGQLRLTASIGVAKISDCGYDHVLQVADLAMYHAKASGGGVMVYGPDRSPGRGHAHRPIPDRDSGAGLAEEPLTVRGTSRSTAVRRRESRSGTPGRPGRSLAAFVDGLVRAGLVEDQLDARVHVQFGEDAGHVGLYRVSGYEQLCCDVRVGQARGDQFSDAPLGGRERLPAVGGAAVQASGAAAHPQRA